MDASEVRSIYKHVCKLVIATGQVLASLFLPMNYDPENTATLMKYS